MLEGLGGVGRGRTGDIRFAEPTLCLLSYNPKFGRRGKTRTSDPPVPGRMLYLTELHADFQVEAGVGFEPTEPCGSSVFGTAALSRSATPPRTREWPASYVRVDGDGRDARRFMALPLPWGGARNKA